MNKIDDNDLAVVELKHGPVIASLPCPTTGGKIHPTTSRFLLKNGSFVEVVHIKPIYYEHRDGSWRPLSEVSHYYGNHRIILNEKWRDVHPRYLRWLSERQKLINGSLSVPSPMRLSDSLLALSDELQRLFPVGLSTLTVRPDASSGATTVDGEVDRISTAGTWAAYRAAAGNASDVTSIETRLYYERLGSNSYDALIRVIFTLDTSSLGSSVSVSAADYMFCSDLKTNNGTLSGANTDPNLVASTPASNNTLVNADYSQIGSTSFGSIAYASITADSSTFNTISLNASGLANISLTGISKFGVKYGADFADTDTGSTIGDGRVSILSADNTGTTVDPKMVITYAASASTTPRRKMMRHR